MEFLFGLAGTLVMFVGSNAWQITITWLLYLIWRELQLIRVR